MKIINLIRRPGGLAIVLMNLYPIFAIIYFDWSVFSIMYFFWLENVVIGLMFLLKTFVSSNENRDGKSKASYLPALIGYGVFTLVHGLFIRIIFDSTDGIWSGIISMPALAFSNIEYTWGLASLILFYVFDFIYRYVLAESKERPSVNTIMMMVFLRMGLLHVGIIIAGGIVMILGSPIAALCILIALKIWIELALNTNNLSNTINSFREKALENRKE